jgi:hypothetical protein
VNSVTRGEGQLAVEVEVQESRGDLRALQVDAGRVGRNGGVGPQSRGDPLSLQQQAAGLRLRGFRIQEKGVSEE